MIIKQLFLLLFNSVPSQECYELNIMPKKEDSNYEYSMWSADFFFPLAVIVWITLR